MASRVTTQQQIALDLLVVGYGLSQQTCGKTSTDELLLKLVTRRGGGIRQLQVVGIRVVNTTHVVNGEKLQFRKEDICLMLS